MVSSESLIERYRVIGKLGKGAFGDVLLALENHRVVDAQEERKGGNDEEQSQPKIDLECKVAIKVLEK